MRRITILIFLFILIGFLAYVDTSLIVKEKISIIRNVSYDGSESGKVDLFYEAASQINKPLMIILHGNNTESEPIARYFARKGYFIASKDLEKETSLEKSVRDSFDMHSFLLNMSDKYSINPDNVSYMGISKGAYTAILTAEKISEEGLSAPKNIFVLYPANCDFLENCSKYLEKNNSNRLNSTSFLLIGSIKDKKTNASVAFSIIEVINRKFADVDFYFDMSYEDFIHSQKAKDILEDALVQREKNKSRIIKRIDIKETQGLDRVNEYSRIDLADDNQFVRIISEDSKETAYQKLGNDALILIGQIDSNATKKYWAITHEDKPRYHTDIKTEGNGIGLNISNSYYRVVLSNESGQIKDIIINKKSTASFLKAVHWNPDVYIFGRNWSHTSDWINPDYSIVQGKSFIKTQRKGYLPDAPEVFAEVNYTFFAFNPCIIVESSLTIEKEILVKALRNNELVFSNNSFTHLLYKSGDKINQLPQRMPVYNSSMPIYNIKLPVETKWISFFNQNTGNSITSIMIEQNNSNIFGNPVAIKDPLIYIHTHGTNLGGYSYFVRGWIYPSNQNHSLWLQSLNNKTFSFENQLQKVYPGTTYYEKNAFCIFSHTKNASEIDILYSKLKYPLQAT